jgi:hypothetical protein
MKTFFLAIVLCALKLGSLAQNTTLIDLQGKWQIVKWVSLIRYDLSKKDIFVYKHDSLSCVHSYVIINNEGMHLSPTGACDINDHKDTLQIKNMRILPVIGETNTSIKYPGLEIDSGVVSETLTRLISYRGKKITMLDTNYDIDWGSGSKLKYFYLT